MANSDDLQHADFIRGIFDSPIAARGALHVGNNLNDYLSFEDANRYAQTLSAGDGDARRKKASVDPIMGRLVEEATMYLLRAYFAENRQPFAVMHGQSEAAAEHVEKLKIVNRRFGNSKRFDVDVLVMREDDSRKLFALSCKGSARERIGQFVANLFLMDDRLVMMKYGDKYFLDFKEQGHSVRYAFVCFDWAKLPDFHRYTRTGKERETLKQTEVYLINDDDYIAGGVAVLNNSENLHGVLNFGQLTANICKFLG